MVARELRSVRLQFLGAACLVLLIAVFAPVLSPYDLAVERAKSNGFIVYNCVTLGEDPPSKCPGQSEMKKELQGSKEFRSQKQVDPEENALGDVWLLYGAGGFYVLTPLAALLGAALISREFSSGGIFFVLSKPISRSRLLLTKYLVCAGVLLAAALLGGLLVGILAAVYGYPVGQLEPASMALSALLMWTGVLSALGIALLASVVFDDVVKSIVATALATFLIFVFPLALSIPNRSWLPYYWTGWGLGADGGPLLTNSGICLVAAAVPLLAALWLFNRKAY